MTLYLFMVNDKKIKEIRKKLRAGVAEGELKEELTRDGYTEQDLAKIFAPHHYDMRSWYMTFALILLIAGLWVYINTNNLLILIFSGLLFVQYYREEIRLKQRKKSEGSVNPEANKKL